MERTPGRISSATRRHPTHGGALPNPTALDPDTAALYKKFALNARQIQRVAAALPKSQYYVTSPVGNRLFELSLDAVALAYCAATSLAEQAQVKALRATTHSTAAFNRAYLESQGLAWAVDRFHELTDEENAP